MILMPLVKRAHLRIKIYNTTFLCAFLSCLVPRRLSLDENVRAKEGGKETTGESSLRLPSVPFSWSLAVHHQSLLYFAINEAPEEEADFSVSI